MKVAIWDTIVLREDGKIMHFDIVVPHDLNDKKVILSYCDAYIQTRPFKTKNLTSNECTFCSFEDYKEKSKQDLVAQLAEKGYAIIELANCN